MRGRVIRYISVVIVALVVCLVGGIEARADVIPLPDGTVINNNTNWSEVPSSYEGVEYYDVLVPYAMKVSEIGGHSLGGKAGTKYESSNKMSDELLSNYVGDHVTRETYLNGDNVIISGVGSVSIGESNGLNIAIDNEGNFYYMIALGHYFWNGSGGFPAFSSANRGQLVDIVLTDGRVIHCIIKDCKSDKHTNGGSSIKPQSDENNGCIDYYEFSEMLYTNGQNMFQAKNSEVLEIFCNSGGLGYFIDYYGLGGKGNHIAFVRMYNKKINDSSVTRKVGSAVSYSLGDVNFTAGDRSSMALGSAALGLTGSNLSGEWDLLGMPPRNDLTSEQKTVVLMGRDSLSLTEAEVVAMMGSNIALLKEVNLLDTVRTGIIFLGLVVLLYGFLLLLAMVFDRANTFIDISLVKIFTFGKLHYDPFEENNGIVPKGFVSTKKLVVMSVVVLLVGVLLVSSGMTRLIGRLLYLVTKYLS